MRSVYLFIDGGHLRRYYQQSVNQWFKNEGKISFSRVKDSFGAQKCFYYDCLDDLQRENESNDEFSARVDEQKSFFNSIREISGCHVRFGSLTGNGRKRRQKEVDILLAVDLLNHAVRDNLLRATLLTGDRDFKPVVDSLVEMGVFINVAGDRSHTSKDLAWAADSYQSLTFTDYFNWTTAKIREAHPVHIREINMPPDDIQILQLGIWKGKSVTLGMMRGGHKFYIDVLNYHDDRRLALEGNDPDTLRLYFELQYGSVEWSK